MYKSSSFFTPSSRKRLPLNKILYLAFIGFKEVLKRQAEQLEDKRKKELEEQKEYDKAREGNKI